MSSAEVLIPLKKKHTKKPSLFLATCGCGVRLGLQDLVQSSQFLGDTKSQADLNTRNAQEELWVKEK